MPGPSPALKYLLILDLEATCGGRVVPADQEIIEFPTLLYSLEEDAIKSVFHEYIRPVLNPVLSPFCVDLTGITQEVVKAADTFPVVWKRYMAYLDKQGVTQDPSSHAFLTCGEWDLKTMLPGQLAREQKFDEGLPALAPPLDRWINVKKAFQAHYQPKSARPKGMPAMLRHLGLDLEGRHHSGIDDCRNILRIVQRMRKDGWKPAWDAS